MTERVFNRAGLLPPEEAAPTSRLCQTRVRRLVVLIPVILSMTLGACQMNSDLNQTTPLPHPSEQQAVANPTPPPTPIAVPTEAPAPTAAPTAIPAGVMQQSSFYSPILGHDLDYQVYLPDGYAQNDQRFPVIYLLHGRGDSMYGWGYIQNDLDRLIAEGTIPPIIAVMPEAASSKGASYFVDSSYTLDPLKGEPVETAFLQDLIPHIDLSYRTIATREGRAIAGYSMGGYAAVRYPLAHPELFSAAIILSPAVYVPLPPDDSSARLFGAFGNGETVFDEAIFQEKNYPNLMPAFEQAKLPFYAYIAVGDDEWRNPQPENYQHDLDFEAARLYNAFAHTRYIVAQFRVLDGGHDWDVWQPAFVEGLTWISRFLK